MREFSGRVAVVTGAASGIGRAIAERCVQEGMRVVLADVEVAALQAVADALAARGAEVLAVPTDVSQLSDIEALAQKTMEHFGGVHLLFNNAGVAALGTIWESPLPDWEWVMGVNLWGVIYGLRVFVPLMLAQDMDCHIINTASVAGLTSFHPSASYQVSKHAVVALSEQLAVSLAQRNTKIKASVLCPGVVNTSILDCRRNDPNPPTPRPSSPARQQAMQKMRDMYEAGMCPGDVAAQTFNAIREERFYIVTEPTFNEDIRSRAESVLTGSGI